MGRMQKDGTDGCPGVFCVFSSPGKNDRIMMMNGWQHHSYIIHHKIGKEEGSRKRDGKVRKEGIQAKEETNKEEEKEERGKKNWPERLRERFIIQILFCVNFGSEVSDVIELNKYARRSVRIAVIVLRTTKLPDFLRVIKQVNFSSGGGVAREPQFVTFVLEHLDRIHWEDW